MLKNAHRNIVGFEDFVLSKIIRQMPFEIIVVSVWKISNIGKIYYYLASMNRCSILLILGIISAGLSAQNPQAYQIFNGKGKKVSFKKMVKDLSEGGIILVGELHNNPISHWLQYELVHQFESDVSVILGLEMLEADVQELVNQYLQGEIDYSTLSEEGRLWKNFATDYLPLLKWARDSNSKVVASNTPRRYARMVHRGGFDTLASVSLQEKNWMAPLPIPFDPELRTYKEILTLMADHASPQLVMAQALKDATMADNILKHWEEGSTFIHLNGAYHSDFYEGIGWYLNTYRSGLAIKTLTTVEQSSVDRLLPEHKGRADFILCVDEDMTKTH